MTAPPVMTGQSLGVFGRAYSWWKSRQFAGRGSGAQVCFPVKVKGPQHIRIGRGTVIREHTWLNCEGEGTTLSIGDRSYIGRFGHINSLDSVVIEADVLIADRVHISDYQHEIADPSLPVLLQGRTDPKPVHIGAGSWIGAGAVIMPGITVGRGAVVGANAVVTSNVEDYAIVAGVPAQVIGSRLRG